eukprot:CAMPEP_0196592540 /NCGR_PEP_ID=MMETSP1081-20130531/73044_1 /TAXON_ID=36882 /ORGANISM="Pyramimonas amylifera, Strain CCMP720" /LENGTH=253 /DNA_ID=CAMNT_0041916267 /DNA_START=639 /DNA_END=1400 /DNA_ORIENTATION=-
MNKKNDGMVTVTSSSKDRQWDDLRKEARKLESEIDQKLAAFSKLGNGAGGLESSALLGEINKSDAVKAKAAELEGLLERLGDLNESMTSVVQGSGGTGSGGGTARLHTQARHRDILMEYNQEFRRTRSSVTAGLQHVDLLSGASLDSSMNSSFLGQSGQLSNASLLRERNMIDNSAMSIDNVIGQAQASLTNLTGQRDLFEGMGSKLNQLGTKFPAIGNLMTAIRRKRSKDTIVLSAVIAACTLFLIVYWLSK